MPTTPATTPPPNTATVRYWAAARAAAGCATDAVTPGNLAEVLTEVRRRHADNPRFARVLDVCSVLVGAQPVGGRDHEAVDVGAGDVVELLPPFAGG
ncbi:MAG: MoaD/ThiS family protein [Nocardioidaceae bacterium]